MDTVHFLNLEYLLLRVYKFFSGAGAGIDVAQVPDYAMSFWVQLSIAGLALALLLLVIYVWVRIKLTVVEHQALHKYRGGAHAEVREKQKPRDYSRFERIKALASSQNESERRRAVLEADALLGETLRVRGYLGEGVGEQLRGANPLQFLTLDLAWQAHRVRNAVAHRGEIHLSEREAHAAIDLYRRVFEEFGVI